LAQRMAERSQIFEFGFGKSFEPAHGVTE
jgi:hypothetical protein